MINCRIFKIIFITLLATMSSNIFGTNSESEKFQKFFDGKILGHGIIFDFWNNPKTKFNIKINCSWDPQGSGILDEIFEFEDNTTLNRNWKINKIDSNKIIATADDVLGNAVGSYKSGNIIVLYDMQFDLYNRKIAINMEDWMYPMDQNHFINRIIMRKFGIKVGEIVIFLKKA